MKLRSQRCRWMELYAHPQVPHQVDLTNTRPQTHYAQLLRTGTGQTIRVAGDFNL
jgi:hypothetical protein